MFLKTTALSRVFQKREVWGVWNKNFHVMLRSSMVRLTLPWDGDPKNSERQKMCWLVEPCFCHCGLRSDLRTSLDSLYRLTSVDITWHWCRHKDLTWRTWSSFKAGLAILWSKLQRLNWLWQIEQVGTVPRSPDKWSAHYATEQVHAQSLAAGLWRRGIQGTA